MWYQKSIVILLTEVVNFTVTLSNNMTTITIILGTDGTFENVLSNSEVDVVTLKRGVDDDIIDAAEQILEEVEWTANRPD